MGTHQNHAFFNFILLFALVCDAVGVVAYVVGPAIIQKIRHDSALVTFEQPFARGEIDSEEFVR